PGPESPRPTPPRNAPPLRPEPAPPATDTDSPVDELALRAGRLVESRLDDPVDLLVDARHARQDGGAYDRERLAAPERIGEERDGESDLGAEEEHEPAVVVRERQVQQHEVLRAVIARQVVDDARH